MSEHLDGYHRWYYDTRVWETTTWLGVKVNKSVSDLWNYQEILHEMRPSLVVEFGTNRGGSALFFVTILRALGRRFRVLTVDIDHERVASEVKSDPCIEVLVSSSIDPCVGQRISEIRSEFPGPMFVVLDSDHRASHVYRELVSLRDRLQPGDRVIVEDGNVNGRPVLPDWGAGPYEAMEQYHRDFPNDYTQDERREGKFGFTFAPGGFLVWIGAERGQKE